VIVEEEFFYRRVLPPILDLLRPGMTPEKMALRRALGAARSSLLFCG